MLTNQDYYYKLIIGQNIFTTSYNYTIYTKWVHNRCIFTLHECLTINQVMYT